MVLAFVEKGVFTGAVVFCAVGAWDRRGGLLVSEGEGGTTL